MGPWTQGVEHEVPPASLTAVLREPRGLHQQQRTSQVVCIISLYLHEDKLRFCLYNFSLNTWQPFKKLKKKKQTKKTPKNKRKGTVQATISKQ